MSPVKLDASTLGSLDVPVPTYDRSQVTTGIVHFGVGGFHRAHQAVYFDELARRGISGDWGITGVGLHRPADGKPRLAGAVAMNDDGVGPDFSLLTRDRPQQAGGDACTRHDVRGAG